MKRLNPNTGLPFKFGDVSEKGLVFQAYRLSKIKKNGQYEEAWLSTSAIKAKQIRTKQYLKKWYVDSISSKTGKINKMLSSIKSRAKKYKISFNLTQEYLLSISPDVCPVFGTPFNWTLTGDGTPKPTSPSLDKIDPSKGYVIGNVQWLSFKANAMKQDATPEEIKQFAQWALQTPK